MTQPGGPAWTPEREISLADARRLIWERFPELAGAEVAAFAQGWDNTAVRVRPAAPSDELIFRIPRRAIALPGVRRELAWLPELAPRLPLPIPVPAYSGSWDPDGTDPWPFWGARMLPGTELAETATGPQQRTDVASRLGAFLRVLHALAPGDFTVPGEAGLATDPMGRADPARRLAATLGCLGRLRDLGLDAPLEAAGTLATRAAELAPPTSPGVICHGDLHVRHVLISGSAITGVIDWGDLCLADPAVDLSIAFAAFSGAQREAFFAAYGEIDATRELRARALAVSLSALLTEYALAHDHGTGVSSRLLPEVADGLARALEG